MISLAIRLSPFEDGQGNSYFAQISSGGSLMYDGRKMILVVCESPMSLSDG